MVTAALYISLMFEQIFRTISTQNNQHQDVICHLILSLLIGRYSSVFYGLTRIDVDPIMYIRSLIHRFSNLWLVKVKDPIDILQGLQRNKIPQNSATFFARCARYYTYKLYEKSF